MIVLSDDVKHFEDCPTRKAGTARLTVIRSSSFNKALGGVRKILQGFFSAKRKDMQQIKEGVWVWPKMSGYKMQCCDCGLTHKLDFIAVDAETGEPLNNIAVVFRAYRINKKKKRR